MSAKKKTVSRTVSERYKSHDAVHRGLRYAEEVVAGHIPAGKYTIAACNRQLNDLKKKKFDYYFDTDEATRVVKVIESFPHTKGKWSGKPIILEDWQLFAITTAFGWLQNEDDLRRFREIYMCLPRKQGKSIVAAGIGLYMLGFDGENGAEVYCGATTEKQAKEVFTPAQRMVKLTSDLVEEVGIQPFANALSIDSDGSTFQRIVGDPGDGQSPSCAIIDEYHEHAATSQYDTMQSGMLAREQPMLLVITTAGSSYGGPCYLHEQDCKKVLDGVIENDQLFSIIYHADDDDDWTSEIALRKANPNLGVSVQLEALQAMQKNAANSPQHANRFQTKHLNRWMSAKTAFMNMQNWNKCQDSSLSIDDFEGKRCIISIDLASKSDLAVVLRLFWNVDENGKTHYYAFPKFYLPEDAVMNDKSGNYARWLARGEIEVTEGNELDFKIIREQVVEDLGRFDVDEVAYDPWRATQLAHELAEAGAETVEYKNNVQMFSEPMKEVQASVNGMRYHGDANECMTWNASNVTAKLDNKDNIYPNKDMPHLKIDGIVALIMAVGRLMYRDDLNDIGDWLDNAITG